MNRNPFIMRRLKSSVKNLEEYPELRALNLSFFHQLINVLSLLCCLAVVIALIWLQALQGTRSFMTEWLEAITIWVASLR